MILESYPFEQPTAYFEKTALKTAPQLFQANKVTRHSEVLDTPSR